MDKGVSICLQVINNQKKVKKKTKKKTKSKAEVKEIFGGG